MVASALIGLDTTLTVLYQLVPFLLVIFLFAFVWSLFFRLRLTANRVLPKHGTVGEKLEYRLIINNVSSKKQKGLLVVEQLGVSYPTLEEFINTPEPGEKQRNIYDRTLLFYRWRWLVNRQQRARMKEQPLPSVPSNATQEMGIEFTPLRRGYLSLTGLTFARPDPFNLYKAFSHLPLQDSILILPKRYELPGFSLPGTRKFKQGGVALASSIGESDEFVSLRDYRPGDPLRRIHWRSWAKTGKPIVKEYQDEYFVRHALVLDTFQRAAYGDVFEEAVSLAASFAYTIRTQDSLLDLMFIGPETYCFTSGRSLAHTEQMLEILASVRVCSDKPFSVLPPIVFERSPILSGCICILLAWDMERQNFVEQLRSFGLPLRVFVIIDQQDSTDQTHERPEDLYFLEVGKVQEGLHTL